MRIQDEIPHPSTPVGTFQVRACSPGQVGPSSPPCSDASLGGLPFCPLPSGSSWQQWETKAWDPRSRSSFDSKKQGVSQLTRLSTGNYHPSGLFADKITMIMFNLFPSLSLAAPFSATFCNTYINLHPPSTNEPEHWTRSWELHRDTGRLCFTFVLQLGPSKLFQS